MTGMWFLFLRERLTWISILWNVFVVHWFNMTLNQLVYDLSNCFNSLVYKRNKVVFRSKVVFDIKMTYSVLECHTLI